jgi:uncharacterized protein YuzE
MKIKYFQDTDTLLVNFTDKEISETRDLNENTLIELDNDGNLVSMTIEHATNQADIADFSYQHIMIAPHDFESHAVSHR